MEIRSVSVRLPSKRVTNDDIIEHIRSINSQAPEPTIRKYCRKVDRLLRSAGAETRYIRDLQAGEKAFDLLAEASRSAILSANINPQDIDLLIYCGIGRGFLEPANGAFLASKLGLTCDLFDVVDACMSWTRALHIANSFFLTESYSTVLVVNAEFNVFENGYPGALRLREDAELAYSFAALTVGECTTATVLTRSSKIWNFRFRTNPEFASLCNLPLPGFRGFCDDDPLIGLNGAQQLTAHSAQLTSVAVKSMARFVEDSCLDRETVDLWIPHSSTEKSLKSIASYLGVVDRLYIDIFLKFGNVASASIPLAIYSAAESGRLKRGHRVVFCPAAAGMVFGLVDGIF